MIKNVTKEEKIDMGSVIGGAIDCICDCDSPGCLDWISQAIAIAGSAASWIFVIE